LKRIRDKSGDYREMLALIRNTMKREGISKDASLDDF
jgi:hypothetical protein